MVGKPMGKQEGAVVKKEGSAVPISVVEEDGSAVAMVMKDGSAVTMVMKDGS